MTTAARHLALAAFAVVLTAAGAAAQQSSSVRHHSTRHHAGKSEATADSSGSKSTWSETKNMTRQEWKCGHAEMGEGEGQVAGLQSAVRSRESHCA